MLTKFWDKINEGLAGEWLVRALTPAVAFYAAGTLAFALTRPNGWEDVQKLITMSESQGIAIILLALILLAISGGLVSWLTLPILRLAEGYWPWVFAHIRYWRVKKVNEAVKEKAERLLELRNKGKNLTLAEQSEYARLDEDLLLWYPSRSTITMPTRLGNILRAAEEYPLRYGLEINTNLPRLWMILPDTARNEIENARQALDEHTRLALWSGLLSVWVVFTPWMILPAVIGVLSCYNFMLNSAKVYSLVLRAAFDLYRLDLYEQLKWPLPPTPSEEQAHGKRLNRFLYRFDLPSQVHFISNKTNKPARDVNQNRIKK